MALPKDQIEEWKKETNLYIQGYRSTSLSYHAAKQFAEYRKTDKTELVILKIKLENKESNYFICLDRPEYTIYPDEDEILLQSGLKAKVDKV